MTVTHSFGAWLRRARKQHNLTQKELADQVPCSESLLRKIESGERRPTLDMVQSLAELLGIPAEERPSFERLANAPLLSVPPATLAAPPATASVFPARIPAPPSPFIGRAKLLARIVNALRQTKTRLLTLHGAPGVGKTRLAIEVALRTHDSFANGACVVELAPLRDPDAVPATILALLGERPDGRPAETQLRALLAQRQLLLVLDNCEHLLAGTALTTLVSGLLAACPYLKVLATSRTAFAIRAETQVSVESLALPARSAWHDPTAVAQAEAVAFFLDRVRAIVADYELSAATSAPIAELCQRLDGLPLALELIAARAATLPPAELLAQMEQRLPWLADGPRDLPERQQTLHAAIRWSYDLLSADEQRSFARLGVFVGGFTTAAAAALGIHDLARLQAWALIQPHPPGDARFTMLETLREFANECLDQHGERSDIEQHHARWFLALAQQADAALQQGEFAWLTLIDADMDNLRAAMRWSLAHDRGATAARIARALLRYWRTRGLLREGGGWLEQALADDQSALTPAEWAEMFASIGFIQSQHADSRSVESFQRSLALYRSLDDRVGAARVLNRLAMIARYPGNFDQTMAWLNQSDALSQHDVPSVVRAETLNQIGRLELSHGAFSQAEQRFREAVAILRTHGTPREIQIYEYNIAEALWRQGNFAAAAPIYREILTFGRAHADPELIADAQLGLGRVAIHAGDFVKAHAAYTESLTVYREIGIAFGRAAILPYTAYLALLRGEPDRAEQETAEGLPSACTIFDIEPVVTNCVTRAAAALALKQPSRAARYLGAAAAINDLFAPATDSLFTHLATETMAVARTQLGPLQWANTHDQARMSVGRRIPTVRFPTVYDAMRAIDLWAIIAAATVEP